MKVSPAPIVLNPHNAPLAQQFGASAAAYGGPPDGGRNRRRLQAPPSPGPDASLSAVLRLTCSSTESLFPTNHQPPTARREMDGHLLDDRYPVPGRSCSMMNVLATWERERPGTLFSPRAQHERAAQSRFPHDVSTSCSRLQRARDTTYAFLDDAASALRQASAVVCPRLWLVGCFSWRRL